VPGPLVDFLNRVKPDVVLLTPLIYLRSTQVLWLRAARQIGVPSVFCVHSWDNLTTKGTLHDMPTQVLVWNHAQCAEAEALHGVDKARCKVIGATAFDHWFSTRPAMTREEFLRSIGLPVDRKVLLYLCSSHFIAKGEVGWIEEWIRALRAAADPAVRNAAVIVRPHPSVEEKPQISRLGDPAASLFPAHSENPVSDEARLRYFHSLYYSDAVVGLNTTSMIEAAILDKPVLSIREARISAGAADRPLRAHRAGPAHRGARSRHPRRTTLGRVESGSVYRPFAQLCRSVCPAARPRPSGRGQDGGADREIDELTNLRIAQRLGSAIAACPAAAA
jgi:hypothetical protein